MEKNNVTIAVNVLYAEKEKMYPLCVSKNNSNHEKFQWLQIGSKLSPKDDDDGIILHSKKINIIKRNNF